MDELDLRQRLEDALITPIETRGTALAGPETTAGVPNAGIAELERRHLLRAAHGPAPGGTSCRTTG